MRFFVSAAALCSSLLLSSCSGVSGLVDSKPNEGPCPAVGSLYEAQRVVDHDGNGTQYTNIEYTGEINAVRLFCRYTGDNPIEAQVEIDFAFGKGQAAVGDIGNYQYFVAVTKTNSAVIAKQVFPLEVKFPEGEDVVSKTELVGNIVIPRANETVSGANFEILVGFELTPEQRKFNEEGRRYLLQTK